MSSYPTDNPADDSIVLGGGANINNENSDDETGPLIEVFREQRRKQYDEENKHLRLHERWWKQFSFWWARFLVYIWPTKRRVIFYLRTTFPIVETVLNYPKHWREYLPGDIIAGISIATLLIPQAISYASVAGLPAVYGLYSSFVPMSMYLALGSSHHLNVAPVAVLSLLVSTTISTITTYAADPNRYVACAIYLAMLSGIWQIGFGILNIGYLLRLLSPAFIGAFVTGSAFTIGSTQLGNLFGFSIANTSIFWQALQYLAQGLGKTNWLAPLIGMPVCALVIIIRRYKPVIPTAFISIIVATFMSWLIYTKNNQYPVWPITGPMPPGLPGFAIPSVSNADAIALIGPSIVCTFIGYMESYSLANKMGDKYGYKVRGSQEFIALGVANLVGSCFQAYPVTGSFSRTAEADLQGARTLLYSLVSIISVILSLLFFTPAFQYIPKSILSAVILAAVYRLIDFATPIKYYYTSTLDFLIWSITFIGVIVGGTENGLAIGAGFQFLALVYTNMFPYIAYLGEVKGPNGTKKYLNVKRFPQAKLDSNILIMRFDHSLVFLNKDYFIDTVIRRTTPTDDPDVFDAPDVPPKVWILDGSAIHHADYFGAEAFLLVVRNLRARGISPLFAYIRSHVKDILIDSGFMAEIGEENFHFHVEDAVVDAQSILRKGPRPSPKAGEAGVTPVIFSSASNTNFADVELLEKQKEKENDVEKGDE